MFAPVCVSLFILEVPSALTFSHSIILTNLSLLQIRLALVLQPGPTQRRQAAKTHAAMYPGRPSPFAAALSAAGGNFAMPVINYQSPHAAVPLALRNAAGARTPGASSAIGFASTIDRGNTSGPPTPLSGPLSSSSAVFSSSNSWLVTSAQLLSSSSISFSSLDKAHIEASLAGNVDGLSGQRSLLSPGPVGFRRLSNAAASGTSLSSSAAAAAAAAANAEEEADIQFARGVIEAAQGGSSALLNATAEGASGAGGVSDHGNGYDEAHSEQQERLAAASSKIGSTWVRNEFSRMKHRRDKSRYAGIGIGNNSGQPPLLESVPSLPFSGSYNQSQSQVGAVNANAFSFSAPSAANHAIEEDGDGSTLPAFGDLSGLGAPGMSPFYVSACHNMLHC